MALHHLFGSIGLRSISYLRRTLPRGADWSRAARPTYSPPPPLIGPPISEFFRFRSFAAPPQAQTNKKAPVDEGKGPHLNQAITAPFVRLVTDEGHQVVSRIVALQRASQLDLDLVQVDGRSDPPVCKLMDFHKENYKKDVKEKEKAKTKSGLTLRPGENKEVHFKAKSELKDLKVKADTIIRLMEKGYRVRCMAIPSSRRSEEDLASSLSRMLALIEDVSIVESGPHLESKQAYVIIRHVKFGPKKAGKKISKSMGTVSEGIPNAIFESSIAKSGNGGEEMLQDEEWEQAQSDSEENNAALLDHVEENSMHLSTEPSTLGKVGEGEVPSETNRYAVRKELNANSNLNSQSRLPPDPRSGSKGRLSLNNSWRPFQPHKQPLSPPRVGKLTAQNIPGFGMQSKLEPLTACNPSEPSARRLLRYPIDSGRDGSKDVFPLNNNQRPLRKPSPPRDGSLHAQNIPGLGIQSKLDFLTACNSSEPAPIKRYGAFSSTKSAVSTKPTDMNGTAKVVTSSELPKSFGIFSSPKSTQPQNVNSSVKTAEPANSNSRLPKFGNFLSRGSAGSSEQPNSAGPNAGNPGRASPPTPRLGLFDAKITASENQR